MSHVITLIPGDGIGPEVTKPTQEIIKATGVEIEWESFIAGAEALGRLGKTVPDELMDSIRRNKVALKGPLTTPVGEVLVARTLSCGKPWKHIGEAQAAERIYVALVRVFTNRKLFTPDLGGTATTTEFAEAIIDEIES